MKTIYSALLLLLSSVTQAQFPFFDDFESANAFGVPAGYTATGGPNVYLVHGVGGGKAFTAPRFTFSGAASITTPTIGPLSADAILSFKWRAATAIASVYPVSGEPLQGADFINVSISTDGTNFTLVQTLNSSNTTASTSFATVFVPLTAYSGQNVKVRFNISTSGHSNDFFIDFDDLSLGGTVVTCVNDADNDGVCDEDEVPGCSDPVACNFNSAATDPGICEYAVQYYNCDGSCINDTDGDGICNQLEIQGCQDMSACNYNPNATDNVGCVYVVSSAIIGQTSVTLGGTFTYSYPNNDGSTYAWTITNGTIVSGQGTSSIEVAWNVQPGNGSLNVVETNSIACEGNAVILNVNIAESGIQGCTDPTACNYDPDANVNIGCVYLPTYLIDGTANVAYYGSIVDYAYPSITASTYAWTVTNGVILSGQGSPNITVQWGNTGNTGSLTVTETSETGCVGSSVSATQQLLPSNVVESNMPSFVVYPNPSNDVLFLQGNMRPGSIVHIFTADGRLIASLRYMPAQPLALDGLAQGTYVINIDGFASQRITVLR